MKKKEQKHTKKRARKARPVSHILDFPIYNPEGSLLIKRAIDGLIVVNFQYTDDTLEQIIINEVPFNFEQIPELATDWSTMAEVFWYVMYMLGYHKNKYYDNKELIFEVFMKDDPNLQRIKDLLEQIDDKKYEEREKQRIQKEEEKSGEK